MDRPLVYQHCWMGYHANINEIIIINMLNGRDVMWYAKVYYRLENKLP